MNNIIFIAPPAAGKGTISDYLVSNYSYNHLSTGDMLREEVKSGSELGREIDNLISKGNLVSDEIIIRLVEEKLVNLTKEGKPFILDGFPRTLPQAKALDEMLNNNNIENNLVIYLDVSMELAIKRALGRLTCPKCKKSYNIAVEEFKPLKENICDNCNSTLEKRSDDNEEAFKKRFDTYLINTEPILEFYKEKGLLIKLDASTDINKLLKEVVDVLNKPIVRTKNLKKEAEYD